MLIGRGGLALSGTRYSNAIMLIETLHVVVGGAKSLPHIGILLLMKKR
jgi:hypothetical protein